jgi:hypothetical protein
MRQVMHFSATMILVVLILAGAVLPVAAQDGSTMVNCNGLSDADCEILTTAADAMSSMSSFTIPEWSFDVNIAAGEEAMNASGSGSARLVIPGALLALMSEIPSDMTDVNAMLSAYQMITSDLILDMLDTMGADLVVDNFSVSVPGEIPTTLDGLQAMYKDRGVFMHMTSPTGAEAWFGQEIDVSAANVAELEMCLEEMQAALEEGMADPAFSETFGQMDDLMGLVDPLTQVVNAHTTTVRGDDMELMGQTMMPFTTTVDLLGMVNDPDLASALVRMLEDPMLAELTGGELANMGLDVKQLEALLAIAATFVNEGAVTSTIVVGADGFVHQMSMDMVIDVNLAILGDPTMPGLRITADYAIGFDAINSTTLDDLAAPATFQPLEMLGDFLVGGPDMIDATVALGDTFSSSMSYDGGEDVLALPLAAGDAVLLTLDGDEYPYVDVYGPDGFAVARYNTYYDDTEMAFTAEADGTYVIVVTSYWELHYDLTIVAQ